MRIGLSWGVLDTRAQEAESHISLNFFFGLNSAPAP
jgi:hypothetical protein